MSYRADLSHLWKSRGFRVLTRVRVLSQGGDGAFQVGIVAAFFFDPNAATTPAGIAAGFAIMFAPFTLVGPFVGPLIDRWHRQRIVLVGNLVRIGLVAGIVAAVLADAPRPLLYVLALVTLSVNRFLLAALSAGIPQVVAPDDLLTANAIMPTLGTIAATLGATVGGVVSFVVPGVSDDQKALVALAFAAVDWSLFLDGHLAEPRVAGARRHDRRQGAGRRGRPPAPRVWSWPGAPAGARHPVPRARRDVGDAAPLWPAVGRVDPHLAGRAQ